METISSFSSDELRIVEEDTNFDENKRELEIAYAKMKSGIQNFIPLKKLMQF